MALKRPEYRVYPSTLRSTTDKPVVEWRFRLIAKNGQNVGPGSEPYPTKAHAIRGAKDARRAARLARVVVAD